MAQRADAGALPLADGPADGSDRAAEGRHGARLITLVVLPIAAIGLRQRVRRRLGDDRRRPVRDRSRAPPRAAAEPRPRSTRRSRRPRCGRCWRPSPSAGASAARRRSTSRRSSSACSTPPSDRAAPRRSTRSCGPRCASSSSPATNAACARAGAARRRGRDRAPARRFHRIGLMAGAAEENLYEVEELLVQPGTYFNPQTEVVVIVDDSPRSTRRSSTWRTTRAPTGCASPTRSRSTRTAATGCSRASRPTTTPARPARSPRPRSKQGDDELDEDEERPRTPGREDEE